MSRRLLPAAVALGLIAPRLAAAAPPNVTSLFPAGGGRGETVAVTAAGSFERWPVRVWVDEPGVVFEPADTKGQFTARVAADAPAGPRLVRFYDEQGASAPRPFLIGTVPEVVETEPNDAVPDAQELATLPLVVNGRLARRGDVDAFAVELLQGQTLIAALDAQRRLGSPMDGVLQLVSAEGFVLEQADDGPGLDPLLTFTAPAPGRYVLRLFAFPATPTQAIAFAGGDDFIYRLTVTTRGYLAFALPLALGASETSLGLVELEGWNVPAAARRLRATPTGRRDRLRAWHPLLAGDVEVPVVPTANRVELPAAPDGKPQTLPLPVSVSGRLTQAGEEDRYQVALRKGQAVRFVVQARALGSPVDPVLILRDEAGRVLAEQDDSGRDSRDVALSFTATADGPVVVAVRDLNGRGGPRCYYRLDIGEPRPDFELTVREDRFTVAPGKPAQVTVSVARQGGHAEPIPIEVVGLPDGVTASVTVSEPRGNTARSVTLTLEAGAAAAAYSGPVLIVGRSADVEKTARATITGLSEPVEALWITVSR